MLVAATSGLTLLAGCSGSGGDNEENAGSTSGRENPATTTTERAEQTTEQTTEQTGSEPRGPAEQVVYQYLEAIIDGDLETKRKLLHENPGFSPAEDARSFQIHEVDRLSLAEVVNRENLTPSQSDFEGGITNDHVNQVRDNFLSDVGIEGEEYAFVYFNNSLEEAYILTVKLEGEWTVYSYATRRVILDLFVEHSDFEAPSPETE